MTSKHGYPPPDDEQRTALSSLIVFLVVVLIVSALVGSCDQAAASTPPPPPPPPFLITLPDGRQIEACAASYDVGAKAFVFGPCTALFADGFEPRP